MGQCKGCVHGLFRRYSIQKCRGYGNVTYKNESGRNDIVTMKVAHDDNFIYFYVKQRGFDPSFRQTLMNLFISTETKRMITGMDTILL